MTAETAVLLPGLAVLVALLLAVVRVSEAQLAVQDAARVAARAAARGESATEVERLAWQVGPPGARVDVTDQGDLARVEVAVDVRALGPALGWLPGLTVRGSAVAAREAATSGLP